MHKQVYNISIIGAGQLGSRHLQGLAKMQIPCKIEVVDPFAKSLQVAEERFSEIPKNKNIKKISFFDSINKLNVEQDLVIIATTAEIRLKVLQELLQHSKVKNIILEKVVFQALDEFQIAEELFKKADVSAWVNCVRRVTPSYHEIKKSLQNSPISAFKITLGDFWGLGSNALHFIDCMAFLCECDDYSLDGSGLNSQIKDSKRSGFQEFSGSLIGKFNNQITFELTALLDSDDPVQFEIFSDKYNITVYETAKQYSVKDNRGVETEPRKEFSIPFQSDLTHITATNILLHKRCDLPFYDESFKLHIPMLKVFMNHIAKINNEEIKKCPIT